MKPVSVALFLCVFAISSVVASDPAPSPRAAVSPQLVLNAAISIVSKHALRARDVDWAVVTPQILAMAANAKVPSDVYPAIRALLKQLNDHRSYLVEPSGAGALKTESGVDADPVVTAQTDGIGYVMMPHYVGASEHAAMTFVSDMVSRINRIATQVHCGWIVDLRNDSGGNMYPMLGALSPLLGQELWGSFRDGNGRVVPWHTIFRAPPLASFGPDVSVARVALLIGPHTSGAGEAVAIAFRGRANTRSFGEPTAGRSTTRHIYPLPDGSQIVLTVLVDLDRNGQEYGDKLQPDQPVSSGVENGSDAAMHAATAWLKQANDCE